MAKDPANLADFIELGEAVFHVQNPQAANFHSYKNDLQKFLDLLGRCNLTRTRTAAEPLGEAEVHYFPHTGGIHPDHSAQLRALVSGVARVLYDEANSKSLIVTDIHDLPKPLVNLPTRLGTTTLHAHQEVLRQDVLTCFMARAFRPAIVTSWALGFDLVRSWVYSDASRLSDFNQLLGQRTQRVGQRQILNYQDFFSEKESFVLEICRDASASLRGFTTKTHRLLENLLDDRNAFAHANYAEATESEAKAYIERLLRVLTDAPFV